MFIIQHTDNNQDTKLPLFIGITFFIVTSVFLYFFLRSIAKIEKEAKEKLILFQKKRVKILNLLILYLIIQQMLSIGLNLMGKLYM